MLSEYKAAYKNELKYIKQVLDQPLTEEQIFNVEYIVLQRLIEKKLLLNLVDELNLKIRA
ncbi:hypothetical protein [Candidatus Mesenet endosymbiont of Phosphuga atrata]|uniref:hypothetical protein n=1 Tax=Candidatus Mesenet endosymbiont of Phosphuga atrata TaxID=3066221 RepID=UPI0030D16CC5